MNCFPLPFISSIYKNIIYEQSHQSFPFLYKRFFHKPLHSMRYTCFFLNKVIIVTWFKLGNEKYFQEFHLFPDMSHFVTSKGIYYFIVYDTMK